MKNARVIIVSLAFFFIAGSTFATDIKDYLDEFIFLEQRVAATTIEMYMYVGWFPDKKEWMKEASEVSIGDLNDLEQHLKGMSIPEELSELKEMYLNVISKLKDSYKGIEEKSGEVKDQEAVQFRELYSKFQEQFAAALTMYRPLQELPEDFDPQREELSLAKDEQDQKEYLKAILLIEKKDCGKAYAILKGLLKKYEDSAFGDCVALRISDCLLMSYCDVHREEGLEGSEEGLKILAAIVDQGRYSPVLYETFYKWRTMEQYYNHGMSNMSEIPNKEYNEKRWRLIQLIKNHLKDHSKDMWAQEQVELLLSLPNIARGGPMGNRNLEYWGSLYVDLSELKSEK